jgi:CrcB protein
MSAPLLGYVLVFLGGGVGAAARHGMNRLLGAAVGGFPIWTFAVNILGCFIMGVLAGLFAQRGEMAGQNLRLFLTTGILGGFTTFSAFSLDAALLWEKHDLTGFAAYTFGTVILCLVGVFVGLFAARAVFAG